MIDIFTNIYNTRDWSSRETVSGTGSELRHTDIIRKEIPELFKKHGIERVLDLGCGDVNWMKTLFYDFEYYLGIDLVEDIIFKNLELYQTPTINFIWGDVNWMDIKSFYFDVIIMSDVLVHLSYRSINRVLNKVRNSGVKYLLMTHFLDEENENIADGEWRRICWTREPFNWCPPISSIIHRVQADETGGKTLSLWKMEDVL